MNTNQSAVYNGHVESGNGQRQARRRLLYIEDNPSNLTLVEWILKRDTDIELISATSGMCGLELAREQQPDLIVLDLQLPDMDGQTVLLCLQAEAATSHIPVVVLSADDSKQRMEQLLGLGALDYLTKPLDIPRLLAVISAPLKPRM